MPIDLLPGGVKKTLKSIEKKGIRNQADLYLQGDLLDQERISAERSG